MKGKMELTIGICVGSSIVRVVYYIQNAALVLRLMFFLLAANCFLCCTTLGHRWLGVSLSSK